MDSGLAANLVPGDLGSTFGGGPVAAKLISTVIDAIETEGLLDNVRRQSQLIRDTCGVGPIVGFQGVGFLLGLRTDPPAAQVRDALLQKNILVGTSADPNVIRLLPPLNLGSDHVERLASALQRL